MTCTVLSFVIKRSISVVHEMKHDTVPLWYSSRTTFEDNFNLSQIKAMTTIFAPFIEISVEH